MIRVKFILNRFGWDAGRDAPPIESVWIIRDISAEQLPQQGDTVDVGASCYFRPVTRHRTSLALAGNTDGIAWIIQMKSEEKGLFSYLCEKGWQDKVA